MMAPKPKPSKQKELQGGYKTSHNKPNDKEPMPESDGSVPVAPDGLDKDGKAEWGRVAGELHKLGLLTKIDKAALAQYCFNYSIWIKATREIQKDGMVIIAQSGFPVQSPYLAIANKAQGEMRKWMTEFGMTPSSRTKIKADPPKGESDLDKFMKKRGKLKAVKGGKKK